jgi:catechol 2,3-dioxygenase-like lactoylglutathione lyase family enzyme
MLDDTPTHDEHDETPDDDTASGSSPSYEQTPLPFDPGELPAGFDPLIVHPIVATGETGAIERPGDDRPAWVIGIFFAAFCALISGLVTVAITRDDPATTGSTADAPTNVEAPAADEPASDTPVGDTTLDETPVEIEQGPAETPIDAQPTDSAPADDPSLDDPRLPDLGFASIDGTAFAIESGCATHLPLAPADSDTQVSSYFFRTDSGEQRVIDRRFGELDAEGARLTGVDAEFVSVDDLGSNGAFVATFRDPDGNTVDVAVNPGAEHDSDCSDSIVTNEPAQFAFPYTQIVMFVCADGSQGSDLFAAGTASEGGRFTAQANGDDTVTLTYRSDTGEAEYVDPAALSFESEGRLGYSGVVSNGVDSLDITVDFEIARAAPCTAADLA